MLYIFVSDFSSSQYMGCFYKRGTTVPLKGPKTLFANMTVDSCIMWCMGEGSTFAGVAVSNKMTELVMYFHM